MAKGAESNTLGEVTLPNGDKCVVKMPSIGEVIRANDKGMNNLQAIVTTATGLSLAQFNALPFPIGVKIIAILRPAFVAVGELNQGGMIHFQTH